MDGPDLDGDVRREIEALHEFFVGWFTGALPANEFDRGFLARFDPGFLLIPPAGSLLTLDELASSVHDSRDSNPSFRIAIRNVTVQRVVGTYVLATYEEWQRNALASTPPDNARIATVLFEKRSGLRWQHVHETWMPEATTSEDRYDF